MCVYYNQKIVKVVQLIGLYKRVHSDFYNLFMLRQHIAFALLLHVFALAFLATKGMAAEVDISTTSMLEADAFEYAVI